VLRVMTFNLWTDHPASQAWSKRRPAVLALLRQHQPDLIGFQEATFPRIEWLASELKEYNWFGVGRDDGDEEGELNPFFFRSDRIQRGRSMTLWLSPTPEKPSRGWDAGCHRIATFCEFSLPGSTAPPFLAINTHFDHWGKRARNESSQLLVKEIHTWDPHRPVVLLGDFNCSESSAAYRELTSAESAFKDARKICEHPTEGPFRTWRGFLGSGFGRERLDYIFTRHFRVQRHAVLEDKPNGRYPSDHLPVLCDLEFNSPSAS
jgi:endonuclease/exonuclease/phosphatase family metal-dependent hydrolase